MAFKQCALETRLFIFIKRARIVLDVLDIKDNKIMNVFVEKSRNVVESIIDYTSQEPLSDELLNYCYDGLTCLEKIVNYIDTIHFRTILNDKSVDKLHSELIGMLDSLQEKFN